MTFCVRLLGRAKGDVEHIYCWLEEHSPQGAARWLEALDDALGRLTTNAPNCGLAPDRSEVELRQFLFSTPRGNRYRGVFVIVGDECRVLRIRGPGQPPLQADELELGDA